MTTSEKKLTRRSFLATTALTAGAMATASLAGCSSVSTDEKPALSETGEAVIEEQIFTNNCRGNCGGTRCRIMTKVREGKVVRTTPEELTGEAGVAMAGCVKGQANPQRIYSTHRLLHPMLQKGERGSGDWEQISWDEAFALMAKKIQAAFDEYGRESVGIETYCGNSLGYINGMYFGFMNAGANRLPASGVGFERFAQKTGVTMFYGSADVAGTLIPLFLLQSPRNSAEDLANAKTILIMGSNPAEAFKEVWPWLIKAKQSGSRLICMDPRFSHTAAHSDLWVPVRPGTDGAFLLAMCNYIINNDLIDYDYLRNKSVAPLLVKEDGSYLRLSDLGRPPISSTDADGNTVEIDCEVVYDEATSTFGASCEMVDPAILGAYEVNGLKVRTVYDYTLEGIGTYTVEFAAEECGVPAETIIEVAQSYAKDGPSFLLHTYGKGRYYNSWRMDFVVPFLASLTGNACKSGASYGIPASPNSSAYKSPINSNRSSCMLDNPLPNTMITSSRIPSIVETGKFGDREFPLRFLLVMGANPMESCAGFDALVDAYNKIDFVVVHDQFMTDTARYASLALPCSMSFEDVDFDGTFFAQKAIDPVGEGKSNFDVYRGLAEAMGYTDLYEKDALGYLQEMLDTPENIEAGVAFDDYANQGAIQGDIAAEATVGQETNPTGRTQFYLEHLPVRDDMGQDPPGLMDRLPSYEHAHEAYVSNPLREKYPLFGMSYHEVYNGQSMHSHVPWINELRGYEGEPYIVLNENAAAERGIMTGDMVKIFNDRGYAVTRAVVSKGLREDVVVVPRGYGLDEFAEGNANALPCLEATDDVISNESLNDWLCQVEKL